jgi:hypothetical protein
LEEHDGALKFLTVSSPWHLRLLYEDSFHSGGKPAPGAKRNTRREHLDRVFLFRVFGFLWCAALTRDKGMWKTWSARFSVVVRVVVRVVVGRVVVAE